MGAWDQAAASRVLRAELGITAHVAPTTPMMMRLMSANGSASINGTQVTGGSYAAQNVTSALGTEANGSVTNTGTVSYTGMPATTTNGVEIWDSNGTPRRSLWGALTTPKTTGAGDVLSFAASSLTIAVNA